MSVKPRPPAYFFLLCCLVSLCLLPRLALRAAPNAGAGSVWAWGSDGDGELGDGGTTSRNTPEALSQLPGVKALSGGRSFSLALQASGKVWAWGGNADGELGNGTTTGSLTPVQVHDPSDSSGFLTGVVAIAAGWNHGVALKSDGTVRAWGDNDAGQLGDGTTTERLAAVQVTDPSDPTGYLTNVRAISANGSEVEPDEPDAGDYDGFTVAVKGDGTLWGWGWNDSGQIGPDTSTNYSIPIEISGLPQVIAVAAGAEQVAAVAANGRVWAWGDNSFGELGDATFNSRATPEQVIDSADPTGHLTGCRALAAGRFHYLAVQQDGTIRAWGWNMAGALGNGTTTDGNQPDYVRGMPPIRSVAGGYNQSFAVDNSGSLWAWGYNADGELGNGSNTNQLTPINVTETSGLGGVTLVACGSYSTLALRSECTGLASGADSLGQLGDGIGSGQQAMPVPVVGLADLVTVSAGADHSLALDAAGNAWGWGNNADGEVGDGSTANRAAPVLVPGASGALSLVAGYNHSLAVGPDGSVRAWGNNASGQLGDGTTTSRSAPVAVAGLPTPLETNAVAGGRAHSLALEADGAVWAWGAGASGQLGNGATPTMSPPVPVSGLSGAIAIAAGADHSMALLSNGTVWAWGSNAYGQLGNGTATNQSLPVQVQDSADPTGELTGVTAIAAGFGHSLALKTDGTLRAWGNNDHGELGDGTNTNRLTAVPVTAASGLATAVYLAAGQYHSLAVGVDGSARAWGDNGSGQLGIGSQTDQAEPTQMTGAAGITTLAGGGAYSLAAAAPTPGGPPIAVQQVDTTEFSVPLNVTLTGFDPSGLSLQFQVVSLPANGTLTVNGTPIAAAPFTLPADQVTYTPATGYAGLDGFQFQVTDGAFTSSPAEVSVITTAPYSISGTVTYNGSGLPGVTIAAGAFSTTTAADGTYTLSGFGPGAYPVTPSCAGYVFAPTPTSVTLGPSATGVNFAASLPYSISGTITYNGSGLPGVTVTAGTYFATTAADGTYTLSNVFAGTYPVAPSFTGYIFAPASTSVTVGPSASGVNFAASVGYFISGAITVDGEGLPGVTVGAGGFSAATAADGSYSIGVTPGTYAVTPSLTGFEFLPASTSVTVGPNATGVNFSVTGPISGAISGSVTFNGAGLPGVTLTGVGDKGGITTLSATTAALGTYSLPVPRPGGAQNWIVTPSLVGYLFSPASQVVSTGNNRVVAGVDFVATAVTAAYSISGTVTYNGSGLPGVTVTAGTYSAVTAANGSYTITVPGTAATYSVTASLSPYAFAPTSTSVTVGPSASGINFTAGAYSISGTVTDNGAGLPGVTVTATLSKGQGTYSAVTAADGTYTITVLDTSGLKYSVAPSRSGYTFTPAKTSVTVGPSAVGVNFAVAGAYSISGTVTDNGSPLQGVTLAAGAFSATSAADGTYTIAAVTSGTYAVTPSLTGYVFSPASSSVTVGPSATGVNFTGGVAYAISGTVTYNGSGLQGVGIVAGGFSATTAADGTYAITASAGSYAVTPSLTGYTFAPGSTSVTIGPSASGVNFSATGAYSIRGTVSYNGSGLPGVTVSAGGFSGTTAANGTYSIPSVTSGTYAVTPSLTGYVFSPSSTSVTVGPSASGINFTATGIYSISGQVTYNGNGLQGVTVSAGGLSATTAADGTYAISQVPPGTFAATPALTGYTFTPGATSVTVGPSASNVNFTAAGAYAISGTVADNGIGLPGVTVSAGTFTAMTAPDGSYTIAAVTPGTYSVAPSLTGYVFAPTPTSVTVGPSAANINFVAAGAYSIIGQVTYNGNGLQGVTVSAGGLSATTAADGTYAISQVPPGTYAVTPALTGYAFTPGPISVTPGPIASTANFTAAGAYTISGTVADNGSGLPGVTVSAGTFTAMTAPNGTYTIAAVTPGTYSVAPSRTGYIFTPTSTSVTVGPSASGVNFTAAGAYTISGMVAYNGSGLSGVTVSAGTFTAMTAADGTYTIAGVTTGTYAVTPSLTGYVFTPGFVASVTVGPSATGVNFTATGAYTISGTVTYHGNGLQGVAVAAGSSATSTAADGTYTIASVAPGTYSVTPSLTGYAFSPSSTSVTVGPSATNVNFTAAGAYTISGTVTFGGSGVQGVTVSAGGFSAITAANGAYSIPQITGGTYSVTPALTGYVFSPGSTSVTVGPSAAGINFTAAGAYTISGMVAYDGSGLSGVTVSAGTFTAMTAAGGTYTISGLTPGSYSVTPSLTGYAFSPSSTSVTVGPSAANINFTAAGGYSISGTVTYGGSGLQGVTVSAGSFSATTAGNGTYTITQVTPGTYSVSPTLAGYTFTPTSNSVTVGPSAAGINFTAAGAYTISGTVSYNGSGLSGATVSAGTFTAMTAAGGTYTIAGVTPGTYSVTPALAGYLFTPSSAAVTVGPSASGINFTAAGAYTISGTVSYNGSGLSGATVSAGTFTATTAAGGTYTIAGVTPGTYSVTASLTGYAFSPGSTSVTVGPSAAGINFTATGAYTISGTVTYNGVGLQGVSVAAGGLSTTTAVGGTYAIAAVPPGTYPVSAALAGYVFSPAATSVTVGPSAANVNFTAAGAFSISGSVLYQGSGLAGVTVGAVGFAPGSPPITATTAADGSYTIAALTQGTYTVTPALAGYTFSPALQGVNVGPSASGVNFTAAGTYTLTGRVTWNGSGLPGVSVAAGPLAGITAADGTYTIAAVAPGTHSVIPTLAGYVFSPASTSVTLTGNTSNVNFTAAGAFSISGAVTSQGAGLAGVTVAAGPSTALTAADGSYIIAGVTPGSYSVTPGLAGYTFGPSAVGITVGPSATGVNFTATGAYSISGKVTSGSSGLSGVSINAGPFSATTAADGTYTVSGLPAGTYSVTAALSGYTFSPNSASVTVGPSAAGVNFTAAGAYSISGTVTSGGSGLSGVSVAAGAFSATTAADGTYTVAALPPGTYSVTPSRTGYVFSPAPTSVTLGPSATNVNFTAVGAYSISGAVTYQGSGLAGVTIAAGGFSVQTDGNGNYTLAAVTPGSYTVVPTLAGYSFTPAPASITVGPSAAGVDFTAAGAFSISGTITAGGAPLAGVSVAAGSSTTTTNAAGAYMLSALPPGTYPVTPGLTGYTFGPTSTSVTVGPSATGVNFAAAGAYSISGTVSTAAGPLAGARVTAGSAFAVTAADGSYTLTGVTPGAHTVTVALAGFSFSPAQRQVTVGPDATGVAFTGTPTPVAGGKLVVTPARLSFGPVKDGETRSQEVTLANQGKEALLVLVGSVARPFASNAPPTAFTLAPKASRQVVVTFSPNGKGAASTTLIILSSDPTRATVSVKLSGSGK